MKKIKREKVTLEQLERIEYACRRRRCFQSIGFMMVLIATMIGCCMSSYMIFDDSKADYIEAVYNETSVDYLYTDYTVSENFKNKIITFINNLPVDMSTRIKEDWTIIVCKEIPPNLRSNSLFALENYDTSNLLNGGFTYNASRIVYVCSAFKEDIAYGSFVHEIGHVVSFEKGCAHGCEDWINLFYQERDSYPCEGYYASNSAEFFANAFMEYHLDNERLNDISPEINDYISSVLENETDRNEMNIFEQAKLNMITGINSFRTYYYMFAN